MEIDLVANSRPSRCDGDGGSGGGDGKSNGANVSKRVRRLQQCIIHCTKDDPSAGNLTSPKDFASWKTLLHAAKIRKHAAVLGIAGTTPEREVPNIFYHRQCRSMFTLKKTLDSILTKEKMHHGEEMSVEESRRSSRSFLVSPGPVYDYKCIFCDKKNKYLRSQNTRESLTKCSVLQSDESLRNIATQRMDGRILAYLSRDLVAAEGHYHRSCYRNYTRSKENSLYGEDQGSLSCDEDHYSRIETDAYNTLFDFIRKDLFEDPRILKMTELTELVVSAVTAAGVHEVKQSTKKHIRRKLEVEFGDSLSICSDEAGKLLVFPYNLTLDQLVIQNHKLQQDYEMTKLKTSDGESILQLAAEHLRKVIKDQEPKLSWPPQPANLLDASGSIPTPLTYFLELLLSGSASDTPTARVQRLVSSFGQDIVYAVSTGRQKTPKHILLPSAVKSLTNNVELIQILNRLGHGVSYSQIEEIDTALCLQKLTNTSAESVPLPSNVHLHIPTTVAWDNIDRNEETLSGAGTSHRVNGIIVQPKVYGPMPEPRPTNVIQKDKRRTIEPREMFIPVYNAGERTGPTPRPHVALECEEVLREARAKNLLWLLARLHCSSRQIVSGWTGFNIQTRDEEEVIQDTLGYLPTINAPATDLSTVHEILRQTLKIKNMLQLPYIVVVFDQALYAKATDILWKHKERFPNIIPRMGTFHTICTLLGIIGKRFQDAGLRDLCIEAGVIAEGSVAGVMEGRKYNRAIRLHKLLYEALFRLMWKGFLSWIQDTESNKKVHVDNISLSMEELCGHVRQQTLQETLNNPSFPHLVDHFGEFLDHLRNHNGKLSSYWLSYMDLVECLLGLLRASREGHWDLHLASINAMIPWCFAYDNVNYARYLSAYLADMTNLPTDHPDVHRYLQMGGFSVQLGPKNPFGRVPVDQAVEETVNKDTQTAGGTKGFSLKPGAVSRYYLTAEFRIAFLRQLREMVNLGTSEVNHADLQQPRTAKDETDVMSLQDLLENNWINPFTGDHENLVSLSTGKLATADVEKDLLGAFDTGVQEFKKFQTERLETASPQIKFHDRLKKQNLKTFSHMSKKKSSCKVSGREIVLKADRKLFAQIILIAQSRNLQMKDVMKHPLGPVPWSLSTGEGSLRKTSKSALAQELRKNVPVEECIQQPTATIIDGMSLIQKIRGDNRTFGDVASSVFSTVLNESKDSQRVDVVVDVYRQESIKNAERQHRTREPGLEYKHITAGHIVKQWTKFLSSSNNKTSLITFLVKEWKKPEYKRRLGERQLFVTCMESCYCITEGSTHEVPDLRSSQEEADTRLLLHADHAAKSGCKAIVIIAEDTDVFVMCLAFCSSICAPMYMRSKTQSRTQFVNIQRVASTLGQDVCNALIGLHSFTGCDTVSAFAGRGKLAALKLVKAEKAYRETFKQLGEKWELTSELLQRLQAFTCAWYSSKGKTSTQDINELRYMLFSAQKGEMESHQLPPCADCLHKHCLRANYQARIWRLCLEACPEIPSPVSHGWCRESIENETQLVIDWMDGQPAPEAVLKLLSCDCIRDCMPQKCPCIANGLSCTDLCRLKTCSNQFTENEQEADIVDTMDDVDSEGE